MFINENSTFHIWSFEFQMGFRWKNFIDFLEKKAFEKLFIEKSFLL